MVQIHARPSLVSFSSGSCCSRLLTDYTIGVFQIMSEHIVISSWLGNDDSFLTFDIFCHFTSPRIGGNRGKFLMKKLFFVNFMLWVTLAVEEDASYSSGPSANGPNGSNMVCPPLLVLAQGFPSLSRMQWMVLPSVRSLQPWGRSFRCWIRLLSEILIIWEFLLSATNKNDQVHCIVFPTIALTENLPPDVPRD